MDTMSVLTSVDAIRRRGRPALKTKLHLDTYVTRCAKIASSLELRQLLDSH